MYHGEAVDLIFYLAPNYHDYSISALSYEFCPHLAKFDNLNFTLYPRSKLKLIPGGGFQPSDKSTTEY